MKNNDETIFSYNQSFSTLHSCEKNEFSSRSSCFRDSRVLNQDAILIDKGDKAHNGNIVYKSLIDDNTKFTSYNYLNIGDHESESKDLDTKEVSYNSTYEDCTLVNGILEIINDIECLNEDQMDGKHDSSKECNLVKEILKIVKDDEIDHKDISRAQDKIDEDFEQYMLNLIN